MNHSLRACLSALPIAVVGCAIDTVDTRKPNYGVVQVLFATDRNTTGSKRATEKFGGLRSERGVITYGMCEVSIPRDHRMERIGVAFNLAV